MTKQEWESRCAEAEEIVRILGRAFDLIPVRVLSGISGAQWMPSDEAITIIGYAKDRLTEYRMSNT